MNLLITSCCQTISGMIRLNGEVLFQQPDNSVKAFLKAAYRGLGINYPKFYKMDNLCKLAFINAEPLLSDGRVLKSYSPRDIGLILQNSSSSLTSDEKHQETISSGENYFPSPSVFVYTLPNIMAGEIAIRHGIKGENAVFLSALPDAGLLYHTVTELFDHDRIRCCLAGWVEEYGDKISACVFVVEKSAELNSLFESRESIIFEPSNIEKLFKDIS